MQYGSGIIKVDYGAFELKRTYQRNLLIAVLIGVALHLAALGVYHALDTPSAVSFAKDPGIRIVVTDPTVIAQPPTIKGNPPEVKIDLAKGTVPSFGIPEPVSGDKAIQSAVLATREQFAQATQPAIGSGGGGDAGIVFGVEDSTISPPSTSFVAVDEMPEAVFIPQPEYPEMARKAGIEGSVWIRVLIDKEGDVRDAIIEKESGANAGFEDSAKKAAMGGKWTPAMQNNQPVPCWVSYKVEFTLD
jgi:protein TonB